MVRGDSTIWVFNLITRSSSWRLTGGQGPCLAEASYTHLEHHWPTCILPTSLATETWWSLAILSFSHSRLHWGKTLKHSYSLRAREFRIWQNPRTLIQDSIQENKHQAECPLIFLGTMNLNSDIIIGRKLTVMINHENQNILVFYPTGPEHVEISNEMDFNLSDVHPFFSMRARMRVEFIRFIQSLTNYGRAGTRICFRAQHTSHKLLLHMHYVFVKSRNAKRIWKLLAVGYTPN